MNQTVISPAEARFWVRPYEFEGDGSHGAAADVASLEVGGKMRTFWLKTLENRLFFREVGRDENWNFGALDELSETEKLDLPAALARVVANENYGRVVLPMSVPRPCYLLVTPDGRIRCGVPQNSLHAFFERKPSHTMFDNHFLDWRPGAFHVISTHHALYAKVPDFWHELADIRAPLISARWATGSQQEWESAIQAFFFRCWSQLTYSNDASFCVLWEVQSAWSMGEPRCNFYCSAALLMRAGEQISLNRYPKKRLRFIEKKMSFVGQQEGNWRSHIQPLNLSGIIHAPTNHEILEAHLYLRDWIHQRLPPERARQWLDFS